MNPHLIGPEDAKIRKAASLPTKDNWQEAFNEEFPVLQDLFLNRKKPAVLAFVAALLSKERIRVLEGAVMDVGYALVDDDGDIPDFTYGQGDIHHIFTNKEDADKFFKELGNKDWKIIPVNIVRQPDQLINEERK